MIRRIIAHTVTRIETIWSRLMSARTIVAISILYGLIAIGLALWVYLNTH